MSSATSPTPSMDDIIRQKDARISVLERQKQRQVEELTLLRSEIGASQIKHKEDIYWMRLECDSLRRDKEAAEDRMAELLRDIKEMENSTDMEELPPGGVMDEAYAKQLQTQLNKSMQTVGILDNQISMVKKSCDEVVKSLKEEIGDVMDDKCRMEMELMNQMASLDNDKRQMEVAFEENLKAKDEEIAELKTRGAMLIMNKSSDDASDKYSTANDVGVSEQQSSMSSEQEELLLKKIETLETDKKKLAEQLVQSKFRKNDKVEQLEDVNAELQQQVEALQNDLEAAREEGAAEAIQVLDTITIDRQETMATLERVALIWEKADDAIHQLEDVIEDLKPNSRDVSPDTERLLSTLETASLVHGQVKVALLLIELKLRNQLGSLKQNDKAQIKYDANTHDADVADKMLEIQTEAVAAMEQVEESLTEQIKNLEINNTEGNLNLEEALQSKNSEVKSLKLTLADMQAEMDQLQEELEHAQEQQHRDDHHIHTNGHAATSSLGVSRSVMERLQQEVLTVAQRVKDKNEVIERLTSTVNEHKVREAALKKEMKRLLKRRSEHKQQQQRNAAAQQAQKVA